MLLLFSHQVLTDSSRPPGLQPGFPVLTISQNLPKFMSIESVMPSNHLIFCYPLLLLPSIFPCIRVFSNESAVHIKWPEYWSLSFCICPSNEYSGLISFKIDWLDLLVVQRTLKSLLQHHSSKASILRHSAFFMVHTIYKYTKSKSTDSIFLKENLCLVLMPHIYPRRRKWRTLWYSCLRNPMDRGVWWATVHGVIKSWTQLSN